MSTFSLEDNITNTLHEAKAHEGVCYIVSSLIASFLASTFVHSELVDVCSMYIQESSLSPS